MTDDRIRMLEVENDALRARVQQLEAALHGADAFPVEWRLTPSESRMFGVLLRRDLATKEAMMTALYRGLESDEPAEKILDVLICKIRPKLAPFGIQITTRWGQGWHLEPETRARLRRELLR